MLESPSFLNSSPIRKSMIVNSFVNKEPDKKLTNIEFQIILKTESDEIPSRRVNELDKSTGK